MEKLAKTSVPIDELIARRWSPRAFDPEREVPPKMILSLCEAARWAPSCGADEPWRFIVWNKFTDPESYSLAFETLDSGNQKWVKYVPVLIAVIADTRWRRDRNSNNRWGKFDTGAATMNMYLQSFALGLYAHPMGGFNEEKLRRSFHIPEEFEIMAIVAVGFPGDPSQLEPPYFEREFQERKRLPLDDNFYYSEWNNPITNLLKIKETSINVR